VRDVRRARQLVARSVGDQQEATRDAAVLLVDECVANAVRHGGGRFELTITRRAALLRVEVADQSASVPTRFDLDPESESGRGMAIVDMLATRWGTCPTEANGKVVWFELNLD
jgi:serine/threonine-protein kinase RsbW